MRASAAIEDLGDGVVIEVREPRSYLAIGFLLFWLCGWVAGEVFASRALFRGFASGADESGETFGWGPRLFLLGWLAFWTFGGGAAIWTVLKMIWGRSITIINSAALTTRHNVLGIGRTRSYEMNAIRDFRLAPESLADAGAFRFDYGNDTIAIVPNLSYAEAKAFLSRLACLPYLKKDPRPVTDAIE